MICGVIFFLLKLILLLLMMLEFLLIDLKLNKEKFVRWFGIMFCMVLNMVLIWLGKCLF